MTQPTAQYAHATVPSQRRDSRVPSKLTSLALSALLALGFTVVAASPASAATTVQNATELSAAFAAGGTVTLDASFAVTPPAQIAVPANGSVELDLNGHTLTILGTSNRAGIAVLAGSTLTVTDSAGTNGELNVTGGANAAGIGGGELGHAGTINIAGGIINATGGASGAGIGGGIVGNGGTVVISGGTVRATGGEYAAAIGGGDIGGVGGSITIGPHADVTVSASPATPRFLLGAGFPGHNLGTISNSGELTITPGSIFVIPVGTSVANGGTLNVDGEVQNAGFLVNTGGVINVDGGITNTGTIDNAGGVLNAPVGSVAGNDFLVTFDEAYTGAPLPTLMRVLSENFSSADLAAIPNPARAGHTFVAWVEATTTTPFDFSDTLVSDVNLTATWAINTHTITFDSAGGSAIAPLSTDFGTTVTAPNAPTRDGYTFVGWFADAATTAFDFATPITANTTFVARWVPVPANTTTTDAVVAGGAITVSGTGFVSGQSVQVWLHSTPVMLGTLTVAANGTVSGTFSIPLATPAGLHHIVFVDQAGGEHRSGGITITAAAVVPPTTPIVTPKPVPAANPATGAAIASTGADTTGPLQIAVALLLVGAAAVGIRKRKAQTT